MCQFTVVPRIPVPWSPGVGTAARVAEAQSLRREANEETELLLAAQLKNIRHKLLKSNNYPKKKIGDIAQVTSGGTPSRDNPTYWDGDIPWITGADVEDRYVSSARKHINSDAVANSSTHIVPKNAVLLVTRTGVGKVAKAGCDIAISQDLTGIVLKTHIYFQ